MGLGKRILRPLGGRHDSGVGRPTHGLPGGMHWVGRPLGSQVACADGYRQWLWHQAGQDHPQISGRHAQALALAHGVGQSLGCWMMCVGANKLLIGSSYSRLGRSILRPPYDAHLHWQGWYWAEQGRPCLQAPDGTHGGAGLLTGSPLMPAGASSGRRAGPYLSILPPSSYFAFLPTLLPSLLFSQGRFNLRRRLT